jgi:hypothetical protein
MQPADESPEDMKLEFLSCREWRRMDVYIGADLLGGISHTMVIFISTALRTSNVTDVWDIWILKDREKGSVTVP